MSTFAIVYVVMIFVTFWIFFSSLRPLHRWNWSFNNFLASGFWALLWPAGIVAVFVIMLLMHLGYIKEEYVAKLR